MANKIIDITEHQLDLFYSFAGMIADSKVYSTYRDEGSSKKPKILSESDIVLKLMFGHELGLSMTQSLTGLYNEHGRLTLNVDTMMALVQASGQMTYYKEERTRDKCTIWVKRKGVHSDKDDPLEFTYTFEDAKDMGLTKSFNYKNQPDVMLFKRCASKMARTLFGDIIRGLYVEGELTDSTKEEKAWEDKPSVEDVDDVVYDEPDTQDSDDDISRDESDKKGEIDFNKSLGGEQDKYDEPDDEQEDEDEFDPIADMIEHLNLDVNPERYIDGYKEFSIWCVENIEFEQDDEDYTLEDYIIEILEGLNFGVYEFVDYDEEIEEEFDNYLLPWSPKLDEFYKKAIKSHITLNEVGLKDPAEDDVAEDKSNDKEAEKTVSVPQDAGDDDEDDFDDDFDDGRNEEDDEEEWEDDEWEEDE